MKSALKLVAPATEPTLRMNLTRRATLLKELAATEEAIRIGLRQLADERGVAFIRREQVQQEFGL